MKQSQTSKESIKIYESIEPRLRELWNKLIKGDYNMATSFAYQIGFTSDIDDCLRKLKIKRTMVNQKNVQEIEMKDVKPLFRG